MATNISDKDVLANNTNLSGTQSWFYRNVSAVSTEFSIWFCIFQCLCIMYSVCTVKSWPQSHTRISGHIWQDSVVLCRQTGEYKQQISLCFISFKEVLQLINCLFKYINMNKDCETGIAYMNSLLIYCLMMQMMWYVV